MAGSGSIVWRCQRCGNRARACQHQQGKYAIAYRVGKRQRWETVGRNKKEAQCRLNEILIQLQQGSYRPLDPVLFSDFAERWLRDHAAVRVKPLTLRSYTELLTNHIMPVFGNSLLTEITPEDVQRFIANVVRVKGLSPRTANYLLTVLKSMFKRACQWKLLRENPAQHTERVREERQEMGYLTPAEIRQLLDKAQEPYKTLFLTAILSGMRRGELLALQWGDIDWMSDSIHVQRSIFWHNKKELCAIDDGDARWRFVTPKSKRSRRSIVMSPRLREALEIHQITCPVSPCDLVFCNPDGNPLNPGNLYAREFLPTLKAAGLRRIRFHDLRHTYATLLIAKGAHIKFIQGQLGHASIQTTLDRYGHLLPESSRGVGEGLDALVFGSATYTQQSVGATLASEPVP